MDCYIEASLKFCGPLSCDAVGRYSQQQWECPVDCYIEASLFLDLLHVML